MAVAFQPLARKLLGAVKTQEDLVRSQLDGLRERVRITGESPSRPQLCGRYMLNGMFIPMRDLAFQMYRGGSTEDFMLWHDVGFGVNYVISRIALAEMSVRGNASSQTTEAINEIEERLEVAEAPSVQAQAYMRIMSEAAGVERLLVQDPSGFLLIDESVRQLKYPAQRSHYQQVIMSSLVADFVIAGTELAQEGYKRLYPLTEAPSSGNES